MCKVDSGTLHVQDHGRTKVTGPRSCRFPQEGATTTYCRELMNVDFDTKPYRPGEPCACSCFCMDVAAMTAQVNVFSDACLSGFLVFWDEFLQDAQCNSRRYNLLQPLHEALSVSRFLDITATGTR